MDCRPDCAACCIAPSISSSYPGHPQGKPAGVRCAHLDAADRCRLYGDPRRPAVCAAFQAAPEHCGATREEALEILARLERETAPGEDE